MKTQKLLQAKIVDEVFKNSKLDEKTFLENHEVNLDGKRVSFKGGEYVTEDGQVVSDQNKINKIKSQMFASLDDDSKKTALNSMMVAEKRGEIENSKNAQKAAIADQALKMMNPKQLQSFMDSNNIQRDNQGNFVDKTSGKVLSSAEIYNKLDETQKVNALVKMNNQAASAGGAGNVGLDGTMELQVRKISKEEAEKLIGELDSDEVNVDMDALEHEGEKAIQEIEQAGDVSDAEVDAALGELESVETADADESRQGEIVVENIEWNTAKFAVTVLEEVKAEKGEANIEDAKILVSCGRGVKNLDSAHELASKIKGSAVSSSRTLVDAGLMDHERQVGQTGKTVRPEVYLAFGISGAIQHLAGMEESEFIVAVNTDKNAPIFKVANLGIVADAEAVFKNLNKML